MGSKAGVMKIAAKRVGLTLEEYEERHNAGLKSCTKCKAWKLEAAFNVDLSRGDGFTATCRDCRRVITRRVRLIPAPSKAMQQGACSAVEYAVKTHRLAPAKTLPCLDCGGPAVEYHHHLGYERRHWLDVVALCDSCHQRRHWT